MIDLPEDWSDEEIADFRDTVSRILAGMDQVRETLGLEWQMINYPRMREIAERVALIAFDFTVEESVLMATWMLGSARTQMTEDAKAARRREGR